MLIETRSALAATAEEARSQLDRDASLERMDEAKDALKTIALGELRISEMMARLIVVAIKAGRIPHVEMTS